MLSQILVSNNQGGKRSSVALYAGSPTEGYGCVIRGIDGLGPVQSEIRPVSFADLDGGTAANPRIDFRNLTIRLGFHANYELGVTKEDVRRKMSSVLQPGEMVTLVFHESEHFHKDANYDDRLFVSGYVESVESNTWIRDPEVVVNILCLTPYIFLPQRRIFWDSEQTLKIDNVGETPSGFDVFANTRYTTWITVENLTSGESITVNETFDPSEKYQMTSVPGAKRVQVWGADGKVSRRLWGKYSLTKGWPMLYPGVNEIKITHNHHVPIDGELLYCPRFRGI